ncbi:MAG: hypothetical protein JSW19_02565 [Candidatus Bathyarchaeota archaeon]|nr:MAG: hypothetical protein JSW19_02565 [Candidatus Bathyarchaeota archaeon]
MRLRKCAMKREEIVNSGGAHCDGGFVFWVLGLTFATLGVASDAMNISLVLESTSWLLLSIVFCLSGIASWMAWMLAVHLDAIKGKSKKGE